MLVLNLMVLILGYQLVFRIAMCESNYIGSCDPFKPSELDQSSQGLLPVDQVKFLWAFHLGNRLTDSFGPLISIWHVLCFARKTQESSRNRLSSFQNGDLGDLGWEMFVDNWKNWADGWRVGIDYFGSMRNSADPPARIVSWSVGIIGGPCEGCIHIFGQYLMS